MDKTLVAFVFLELVFDGFEVGEQVSVSEDYATRLGRGSGCEDDLHCVTAMRFDGAPICRRKLLGMVGQSVEMQNRKSRIETRIAARTHDQAGVNLLCHTCGK